MRPHKLLTGQQRLLRHCSRDQRHATAVEDAFLDGETELVLKE
jgi:hypothetical protein